MTLRATFLLLATVLAAEPLSATDAAAVPLRFSIPGAGLSSALTILATQAGIEILFSDKLVGERLVPPLSGEMTVDTALETLLAGTGLVFRRTGDGALIVSRPLDAPTLAAAEDGLPEILVIGRRVENSDIRRTEGDIQPYRVFTRREIENAHTGSIDAFARTRLSANTQTIAPGQNVRSGTGSNRSEINLRGLGASQTLLLVDGRRLPGISQPLGGDLQPDINGIPLELIDRIEALTATAGGIYGIGATSGVLNVVLRHDYNGGEVALTTGLTSRGDTFERRIFGRFGLSFNGGRTGVMVAAGHSRADPLLVRDRDYLRGARERALANDPENFLATYPAGNGINVFADSDLVLDESQGGAALGAKRTFIPLGLGASTGVRNTLLLVNAGTTELSAVDAGRRNTITTRPDVRSIFADFRHDFGGGFVAFANILSNRNIGRSSLGGQSTAFTSIAADSALNPFQQDVVIAAPVPGTGIDTVSRITTTRYTIGLLTPLSGDWKMNLEYNGGGTRSLFTTTSVLGSGDLFDAIFFGQVPGKPALDPLADWASFVAAAPAYLGRSTSVAPRTNEFDDATLRVAGPVANLPGGAMTLTLLGEARREVTARSVTSQISEAFRFTSPYPRIEQRVLSLYGETRVPLFADRGLLSGLEFQLAVRQDWIRLLVPGPPAVVNDDPVVITARNTSPALTFGTRFRPLPGVLVRGSIGTGSLPPTSDQITRVEVTGGDFRGDPARGGRQLGSEGDVTFLYAGNPDLRSERARSLLIGTVLTPAGDTGPRLSIDYTRIVKRGEIQEFPLADVDALLAAEPLYASRITRAPLTDADRALGFTAGRITRLDFGLRNIGRTRIDAIDVAIDYPFEVANLGRFKAYLNATWEPHYRQQNVAGGPVVERVGFADGPLEWRGNAGIDWSRGPWSAGLNAQFYSRYRVTSALPDAFGNEELLAYNGRSRVPAQIYVDLAGRYRFDDAQPVPRGTEIRAGIVNLFDHRPPTIADLSSSGVSYYGDPRRRRVEVTVAVPLQGNR
ncbi:TonB-dependent receptor [Glacieibacterium frigidum]|uniref:Secretin/TonB short N-terminal domain-containing protein n=1 Tax=Glacieibacterium frigidum TaxID=2593303 RepID=A0A552UG62_9SPHN|nr:TonB-dependent receptor [Glacieibacterium frigidum]TRW17213.1 hypothetical protein FMM06_03185 [Glacieibacterium frigidum]